MLNNLFIFSLIVVLCGCSSWKDKKAPCTFDDRHGCGSVIEMGN